MKKLFIILLLFVSVSVFSSTKISKYSFSQQDKNIYYRNSILSTPDVHKFVSEDVVDLVKNSVPEQYVEAFLHYSILGSRYTTDVFRLYLLALGQFESNWVAIRSHNINDNGTHDWGYLMLNDGNINNHSFMNIYGPTPYFIPHDKMSLYLIICINYFKDLYLRYGCDALYAYNAGENSYIKNTIPDLTYIYKYKIKNIVDKKIISLYALALKNRKLRDKLAAEERDRKLKEESDFITLRRSWDLLNIVYKLTHSVYFDMMFEDTHISQQLLYDPRKKILKTIDLHSFYIPSYYLNSQEIETALQ
jgi:hypothetical protein